MKITQEIKVVLIVLAVIAIGFLMQKCSYDSKLKEQKADYDVKVDGLQRDTANLAVRLTGANRRADSKQQQLDRQAALYGQAVAGIADLKRTVADQANRLTMGQQIDVIAGALGTQYKDQAERIKLVATPADSALIVELYQRVEWGIRQAAKLDTTLRENARLRTENERLTDREAIYRMVFATTHRRLLTEYETSRFLNIGKNAAILKIARQMESDVSDLEKELNGH